MRIISIVFIIFLYACSNSISESSQDVKIQSQNFKVELNSISFEVLLAERSQLTVFYSFNGISNTKNYSNYSKKFVVKIENLNINSEYEFELIAVSEAKEENRLKFTKRTLSNLLDGSIIKAIQTTVGDDVEIEAWLTTKINFRSVFLENDLLEFVQDDLAGIGLYSKSENFALSQILKGQKIRVRGKRIEIETNPLIEIKSIELVDQNVKKMTASSISFNDFNTRHSIYSAIEIDSILSQDNISAANQFIEVFNNDSSFHIQFIESTNIHYEIPSFRPFKITGIIFYRNGWVILPRINSDL